MGRRIYTAGFDTISLGTAPMDIWSLFNGTSNGAQLHWLQLTASAVTTAAQERMRLKRGTITVTQGTGGTTPAKNLVDDGDTKVSGATLHANDVTTQATTTGNFTGFLEYFQWNVLLPFDYMPGPEDEDRPADGVSEIFILDFPASPAVAYVCSSFLRWREYP
jgi:hypothetical protein